MMDQSRFADSMLGQFIRVGGAVSALVVVGSILSGFGISAFYLSILFIIAGLLTAAIFSNKAALPLASSSGVLFSIEALSAFGLFGIAGAVFAFGHDGLAVMIGLAAGIVLSLFFVAPKLSAISVSTLPDFMNVRYGSEVLRVLVLVTISLVSVLFIAAQLVACGLIASQILEIAPIGGILVGAISIVAVAVPLRKIICSKAQILLAILAIVGGLMAAAFRLASVTGIVVPHFAYGGLLTDASAAETLLGIDPHLARPGGAIGYSGMLALIFCLAVGTAVMPHTLRRAFIRGSGSTSRTILRFGLIFFVVLATALPAIGVLARVEFFALFTSSKDTIPLDAIPNSLLVGAKVCGDALEMIATACAAKGYGNGIPVTALSVAPEAMLLALPSLISVSDWLLALLSLVCLSVAVIAGASAAHCLALSFASRALASETPQIMSVVILTVTSIAGVLAATSGVGLINFAAWAYSLIAAALISPLMLGLWWQRTNANGAISGLIVGFVLTAIYIFNSHWGFDLKVGSGDEWQWFGLSSLMAGTFGIVFSVIATVLVSLIGPKPKPSQLAFLQPNTELSTTAPEVLE